MLALLLQGHSQPQKLFLRHRPGRQQIRHPWLPGGNSSGFVQGNNRHLARLLQRHSGFEQDSVFRTHTISDHNSHRRGQTQGAGAADDKNGNSPGQSKAKGLSCQEPHQRCDNRYGNDRRNKHTGDLVRHLGNGCLGGSGIADHADDLGQRRILPHPGGPAGQKARLVQGGCGNTVARCFVHRDALTSEGRLIDSAVALHHDTVHRNALPGPHHKQIAGLHRVNGNLRLHSVSEHNSSFGSQLHEALQGVGGLSLGTGLQHFSHGDQRQDHGGRLKIELHHIFHDGVHIPTHLGAGHGKQGVGAVDKGGRGSQGHQGVHIGRPVPEAPEAADEEFLVNHHDDDRQQQLGQAHGHMIAVKEGRQWPAPHHITHGKVQQHQQKAH